MAYYVGTDVEDQIAFLHGLFHKGALVWESGKDPEISYLGQVLVHTNTMIVYVHQAEYVTRLKIMWEQALDRADAAGEPVEWTGDREGGIDESIPVPEITRRVREINSQARSGGPST
jgi:hypothetical protein